jgi:hypothetical protein
MRKALAHSSTAIGSRLSRELYDIFVPHAFFSSTGVPFAAPNSS